MIAIPILAIKLAQVIKMEDDASLLSNLHIIFFDIFNHVKIF
ncbi:hypothetical protein VCSRO2_3464 [Vibrio cholerae]|nr:hypothetical protein Sa5Y_VC02592 [Vibrio cholerae]GHX02596.1 hypothetical protein VCSRO2_3464 [Vibrio cholerae]